MRQSFRAQVTHVLKGRSFANYSTAGGAAKWAKRGECRPSVKQPSDGRHAAQVMRVRGELAGDGKRGAVRLRRGAAVHQPWHGAAREWRACYAGQSRHRRQQEDPRQREIARPRPPTREHPLKPARLYVARRVGYTHPDRSFATLPVAGELQPGMRQHARRTHRVEDGSPSAHRPVRKWTPAVFSCLLSTPQRGIRRVGSPPNTPPRASRTRRSAFTGGYTGRLGRSGKGLWRSRGSFLLGRVLCLRILRGSSRASSRSPAPCSCVSSVVLSASCSRRAR